LEKAGNTIFTAYLPTVDLKCKPFYEPVYKAWSCFCFT